MSLTPDAKKLLAETIRGTRQDAQKGLRGLLLRAIHDEADRRYRLSMPIADAGLDEAHRRRRERIEGWIDEHARATKPKGKPELQAARARLLAQAEKEAAATLINRLVLLRQLEAAGLSKPAVVTGGWNSKGYREFREFGSTLCTNGTADVTEGYAVLLQLLFDELATDLPGLFGDVGLTRLFPVPAATLREVIERLDDLGLASVWTDDTMLGWVYQYWNDPDREVLDVRINGGGKIAPHEIASKTQMFTERYMVEWLLQNSLGLTWLCMCKKHGWTPDADAVLPVLEARREAWRAKRDAGAVALDALMPIEGELEGHWKYYVPLPIPEDAVNTAPDSLRSLKLLDPAVGSGHFLVIAFGLLAALYREEARHCGQAISDREIAESILENNLHGIDIDPRAIQIAAAGLYLKAKSFAKDARPKAVNLVAPMLRLGNLPPDDPAVVQLRSALWNEAGIPQEATNHLLQALAGVDHLGSLLKVDATVDDALRAAEKFQKSTAQREVFDRGSRHTSIKLIGQRQTILDKLEEFLARHSKSDDLGLRLDGEQLAAGVRFVRIARAGGYDVVVGNPPYQGLSKTESFGYVAMTYPQGKADLYAAFLERGLELARPLGVSGLITIRGWLFLGQFERLRLSIIHQNGLLLGDLGWGAFELMTDNPVTMSIVQRGRTVGRSVAICPGNPTSRSRTDENRRGLESGLLAHVGRYEFDPRSFKVIKGEPIVYWWSSDLLRSYATSAKIADVAEVRFGVRTSNNGRFIRRPWELSPVALTLIPFESPFQAHEQRIQYVPIVMGGAGRAWIDPVAFAINWQYRGLQVCVALEQAYGAYPQSTEFYFRPAVSLPKIGTKLKGRVIRFRSVVDNAAPSIFCADLAATLCSVNRGEASRILASLNPTINLQPGDILRLPLHEDAKSDEILGRLLGSFAVEESTREPSVEFRLPGASDWGYAQRWAQVAVDRPSEQVLPYYEPSQEAAPPENFVSFAVGIALGRFAADGGAVLDDAPSTALPNGVLFVASEGNDSLDHPACISLAYAWTQHGAAVGEGEDLRTYLRKSFFGCHKRLYENRPIYFPLSSAKRNFVAFASIHRFHLRFGDGHIFGDGSRLGDGALSVLLADHLMPTKRRLEGELEDLRTARATGANKSRAEKRFNDVQKLVEELNDFMAKLSEAAEQGAPAPDDKTPTREVDARYEMDLDDGVIVNSAALWPLLEPQWKDPKKWWRELASAQGKKDYDWSRLAARYFPTRVRKKCQNDPSLALAHKCFWELHPAKAYAWELRLQDEIRPDFTIDEPGSDTARATFLTEHEREASEVLANERKRRARKSAKAEDESEGGMENGPLFETGEDLDAAESTDG